MKRIRITGLCLVAVFVLCALGAASASALEYRACFRVEHPAKLTEYADKGCTSAVAPGTGRYRLGIWSEARRKTYKSKGTSPVDNLVNPETKKVEGATECKKEKGESELIGPKEARVDNSYSKCFSAGKACETPGAGRGNIRTRELESILIPLASAKVGLLLLPKSGSTLAEYNCEGVAVTVKGVVIGEIEGLSGAASRYWTTRLQQRGGVPGNLQEFLYYGGDGTEAEENAARTRILWGACVKAGHTAAECNLAFPGGETDPEPDVGFQEIGPPFNATLPFAWNATESNKGEVTKIV